VPALGSGARTTASVELVAGVDAGQHYGTGGYTGPGTYFICARHSGKVLDVNIDWFRGQDNGQPIYQHDLNNGDNQKFIVEPLPDGSVRICPKHSRANNRCMDVTGFSTQNSAGIQQWEWNGGLNQQFAIEPIGDHYRVRARHSGLYFDIEGISLDNRARLTQWAWWVGNN
jgi:ricin-type beta-trefoil lectin protein